MGRTLTEANLGEVFLTVANVPMGGALGDHGSGGSIKLVRGAEEYNVTTGRSGEKTISRTYDDGATLELTFNQTSPFNTTMQTLKRLRAPFAILLTDARNGQTYRGDKCWVQKVPDREFSNEATDRMWVIGIAALDEVD